MLVQLLLVVLSLVSLGCVRAMLTAPDRLEDRPIPSPTVIFHALDEGYFDTRGLV